MTCLCIDELRPASFRGAQFWVASDKSTYGRRIKTHEYPNRDIPYNEDLGEKAQKFSVEGYLFGDDWVSLKDSLVSACRAYGPAILQLPTNGPTMVVCNSVSVSRTKDQCGFFAVSLDFTGAGDFGVPLPVGVFNSLIGALLAPVTEELTRNYDRTYRPNDVLDYVRDAQIARIAQFTSDVLSAVDSAPSTDTAKSAEVAQTSIAVFQDIAAYTDADEATTKRLLSQASVAPTIGQYTTSQGVVPTGAGPVTVTSGSAAIVPLIASMLSGIGDSMSPEDAARELAHFAAWSVNETDVTAPRNRPYSVSEKINASNGAIFCGCVRSLALVKLAQMLSIKQFKTQREAVQARATIVELFNIQMALFNEDLVVNLLAQARDSAVTAVTKRMANIAPVVQINAALSLPSLYWAGRLYQDVERATELVERNSVISPAFMPPTFSALLK